jgi:hypothetical protein
MNGVVCHGQIAEPNSCPVTLFDDEMINAREHPGVPGPQVKITHGVYFGCRRKGEQSEILHVVIP